MTRVTLMRAGVVLLTALLAVVCTAPVAAQQTTGNVRGVVADPNGAAVPDARVRITNRQTNISQDAQTNDSGEYQFNNLLAGDYHGRGQAPQLKTPTPPRR